jgi:hypothetical protein
MLIPHDDIIRVFKKVKAVRDHMALYHVNGTSHRLSVDTLTKSIADMYGLNIAMFEVLAAGRHVAGNVERYADNRAIILIKSEQSEQLRRFVAVKELCHLMIDEEDDWSSTGTTTLREMKVEFDRWKVDGQGVPDPSRVQKSEMLAWLAAIALLYPPEFHAADKEKVDKEETSVAKIGLYHDMPPYEVENAFDLAGAFALYAEA